MSCGADVVLVACAFTPPRPGYRVGSFLRRAREAAGPAAESLRAGPD